MGDHQVLKKLVLSYLIMALILLGAEYYLQSTLDQALQNYANDFTFTLPMIIVSVFMLITIITHIASLIGLLILKRWAFHLFMITTPLAVVLSLFSGVSIQHSIPYSLDHAISMVGGAIMIYLWLNKNWYITSCSTRTK